MFYGLAIFRGLNACCPPKVPETELSPPISSDLMRMILRRSNASKTDPPIKIINKVSFQSK